MYGPLIFIRCCACIFRLFRKNTKKKNAGLFAHKCEHSRKHERADGDQLLQFLPRCSQKLWNICSCFGCRALSPPQLRLLISKKTSSIDRLPGNICWVTLDFIDNALLPFFHGAMRGIKHRHLTRGN